MDTPKNLSTLYRRMNTDVSAKLSHLELSSSKAMFLFCLYDHGQMSQVEICRELDMDKSTVAKMLVRLEKDGFVVRTTNPNDVRSVLVTLTDKAAALVPQARKAHQDWLDEATKGLTELEKRNFLELIEKVAGSLQGG